MDDKQRLLIDGLSTSPKMSGVFICRKWLLLSVGENKGHRYIFQGNPRWLVKLLAADCADVVKYVPVP
jgi:hypothetical protein